jgi:hypothetical protein
MPSILIISCSHAGKEGKSDNNFLLGYDKRFKEYLKTIYIYKVTR